MTDIQMLERVASSLAGERVIVRVRAPVVAGGIGEALRDKDGQAFINLSPDLAGDKLLWVLCHESAHHKLGHVRPSEYAHARSGAIRSPRVSAYIAGLPREDEADKLAREWLRYADDNAHRYAGDALTRRLRALEFLPFAEMIDRAAEVGVERAYKEMGLKRR